MCEELVCSANPPSVSGVLRPSQGNLSSFNEQSTKGDWVLSVLDSFDLDGGSIDYFALEIETDGEWSNTAPIAFPQATATNERRTDLTLQGLDPERLPLTYTLIDAPNVGNILGQGYISTLLALSKKQLAQGTEEIELKFKDILRFKDKLICIIL